MALTLLFDLDDTLLSNNIDTFLPAYLKSLGKHMVQHVAPDRMIPQLLAATEKMMQNSSPRISLEQSFDAAFYPALQTTKETLRPALDQFYDEVFPTLNGLTSPRPVAVELVQQCLSHGHTLVVATNPLFPQKAIYHRLLWAGLSPQETGFALITSYESFHFAKPNPAYYAEILAQLGWPDQPAVVIGNSLTDDIVPAAQIGLPGFWVTEHSGPLPAGLHPLSASGSMEEITAWLDKIEAAAPKMTIPTPAGLLAVLKSTPAAFDTLTRHLSQQQWEQRPQPAEWSVTEIMCHLRDVDREINVPRLEKIIAENNPFLPGVNSDTWTDERKYCQQDGLLALSEFIDARSDLIERLAVLPPEAWQLPARHAIFGPTTLQELISFTVTHDRSHIQQVLSAAGNLAKP